MSCTYILTGDTFISQPIWECFTCQQSNSMVEGEVICAECVDNCHSACQTRMVSQSARAYCDCGSRGPDKCKGIPIQKQKEKQVSHSHPHPPRPNPPPAAVPAVSHSSAPPVIIDAYAPSASHSNGKSGNVSPRSTSTGRPRSAAGGNATATNSGHARSSSSSSTVSKRPAPTSAATHALAKSAVFSLHGSISSLSTPSPPPFTTAAAIPSECTFLTTGPNFAAQAIYACYTCKLTGDLAVCYYCIVRCHARHKIAFISDSKRSYCDCGSRCVTATKTKPAATSPTNAKSQCHALVPLPYREAQALTFLCTLTQTGANFHLQSVFHCLDCGIRDDEICCESCALVCHKGHRVEGRGQMRAYCDCSANGLCQTLDLPSVVAARSTTSSHAVTPLFNLSRRTSFTQTPQLELTDLSQTNSAAGSTRNSRRSSLVGGGSLRGPTTGRGGGVSQADAPEEKLDAMPSAIVPSDVHGPGEDLMTFTRMAPSAMEAAREAERTNTLASAPPNDATSHSAPTTPSASVATAAPPSTALDPSSPRAIRTLVESMPARPSLPDFLAALDLSCVMDSCVAQHMVDLDGLRVISEKELEKLVPESEGRMKLKTALLALRARDKIYSPALVAASTGSSGTASVSSLSLSPRHASDECRAEYLSLLRRIIDGGVIRPEDEDQLSTLRHQSQISFSDHQSVLRELGCDEQAFEALKMKSCNDSTLEADPSDLRSHAAESSSSTP